MLPPWEFIDPPCQELGPDAFFPETYENMGYSPLALRTLRSVCNSCPFKIACFEWAVRHEAHGFWAGTTERQRRIYRKENNIPFHSPEANLA